MRDPKLQQIFDSFLEEIETYIQEKIGSPSILSQSMGKTDLDQVMNELSELVESATVGSDEQDEHSQKLMSLLDDLPSEKKTGESFTLDLEEFLADSRKLARDENRVDAYLEKLSLLQNDSRVASMDEASKSGGGKNGIGYALELLRNYKSKFIK